MKIRKKHRLINLIFLLTLGVVISQASDLSFQHLDISDGLSQNSIKCMLQDRTGFMWFGTEDGLNRYDGYQFKTFRHDPWDSTSIGGNDISAICEDHAGRLWIGTHDGGLNLYRCSSGDFIRIGHHLDQPHTLSHDSVRTIIEDSQGILWVGTANGLNFVNLAKLDSLSAFNPTTEAIQFSHIEGTGDSTGLSYHWVNCLLEDKAGYLWIGTNWGLNVFNRENGLFHHFYYTEENTCGLWSNYIKCIMQDDEGTLWIGTELGGLSRMKQDAGPDGIKEWEELKSSRFVYFENEVDSRNSLSSNTVLSMIEDGSGDFWIGTEDGLNRMNREINTFEIWKQDPNQVRSLKGNFISSIYQDRSGLLWFGSDQGLNTWSVFQNQFEHIRHMPGEPNSLSNPYVWAICEDLEQNVYIATNCGLNVYSPETKQIRHYIHDDQNPQSLVGNYIIDVLIDSRNILWVAANGWGLDYSVIQPGKPLRFQHVPFDPDQDQALQNEFIMALFEDRKGNIWYSTYHMGLTKLIYDPDLESRSDFPYRFVRYKYLMQSDSLADNYNVHVLHQDNEGNLWAGTDGYGVIQIPVSLVESMTPSELPEKPLYFRHDPSDRESLRNDYVMDIHHDSTGNIWLGTYGGGLNRLDLSTGKFASYTMQDGLCNDVIYSILEDSKGRFWLSTNNGICRFDPATGQVKNFSVSDGLQAFEFNVHAQFINLRGEIFFGGVNGLNIFHPDKIRSNTLVPPIVILGFQLLNDSTEFNLHCTSQKHEPIHLNYQQNGFEIRFAALNYIDPGNNQYRYRMRPVETAWHNRGNENSATYARLSPGEYQFELQGSNNDGVWNPENRILLITIHPPFWQTRWFQACMILTMIGFILFIHYLRTRSIRRRKQLLEIRVHERTEALAAANEELQTALDDVQHLEGLLPICAACKNVRDDKGYWHQVESYISKNSNVEFSHSLCPDCSPKYFPDEIINGEDQSCDCGSD
ncbi:hypothetical protein HQ585_09590 [candidate division KSB1 bacterium]|nr:hypothetical protein [candidate division KSB1 bacterium]